MTTRPINNVERRPRTEAGRALLNLYAKQPGPTRAELSLTILTIGVEAEAAALHDYKAAVDALAEWVAAEDELPLDGFGDDATKGSAWMRRVEEARKGAAAALACIRGPVSA